MLAKSKLKIKDAKFLELAVVLVPDDVSQFDDLQDFKQRLNANEDYSHEAVLLALGKSLHIFPEESPLEEWSWVMQTENRLNFKLFNLLISISNDASQGCVLSETSFCRILS